MNTRKGLRVIAAWICCLCYGPAFAQVNCITMETLPGGGTPTDQMLITNQFNVAPYWVTFSLPNSPGNGPRIANVGPPITAFTGPNIANAVCGLGVTSDDQIATADQGLVGCFFLTDTDSNSDAAQTLRIDYSQDFPTQASGYLLDVHNGTSFEEWEIRAYGPPPYNLIPTGPGTSPNPVIVNENSPFPANQDGAAVPWQLNLNQPIYRIEIVYTGTGSSIGIGFDSFCPDSIPCALIGNESLMCDSLGTGDVTYDFDITNMSGVEVHHIILTPPPGITVTPNVFTFPGLLSAPLAAGETVTGLQVTIGGAAAGGQPELVNFRVSLHDSLVSECCSFDHPLTIDPCCMALAPDSLLCVGGGDFDYTFQFQNLSGEEIHHVYLLGGFPATFSPNYFPLGVPVAPGGTAGPFTTTVSGVSPLGNVSLQIAIHDSLIEECCSLGHTITSPCSTGSSIVFGKPKIVKLHQNHPNPFNPSTVVEFEVLGAQTWVNLGIYDVQGRLVSTLVDGPRSAGRHSVPWHGVNDNGQAVSSGIYFYRLRSPSGVVTKKMMMLK